MRSTSAPMSASSSEANGPGSRVEKSRTFSEDSGPFMFGVPDPVMTRPALETQRAFAKGVAAG